MHNFRGKKILIIGMARSGQAAARYLSRLGAVVTGTDIKPGEELGRGFAELAKLPVRLINGRYPEVRPGDYDLVIMSPGVPSTIPPVVQAREAGIPIWSEMELAGCLINGPVIAITGTNGKTTTTSLTGHILEQAGIRAVVAGNIGIALVGEVERIEEEQEPVNLWVAEVSSFQLEFIHHFRPHIAAFLNLTPDHLDRHGSLEGYGAVKKRIFMNQGPQDFAVLNDDDPWLQANWPQTRSQQFRFSRRHLPEPGIGVEDGTIVFSRDGRRREICPVTAVGIPGPHNLENALAAAACALLAGVEPQVVAEALHTFPGVPHRVEPVRELDGVLYVNDSKGTNPESVLKALASFDRPVILIAGGRHKGSDLSQLALAIKDKVKELVLLGEAAPLIREAVAKVGYRRIQEVSSLAEAVKVAAGLAAPGDVVLLSPACASWDMFHDYEERGDLFRKYVQQL